MGKVTRRDDLWLAALPGEFMAHTSTKVAAILKRLCSTRGAGPVGEAIATVYAARDRELMPLTSAAWTRRGKALSKADAALARALQTLHPVYDAPLERLLRSAVDGIRRAAQAPKPRRAAWRGSQALDRESLEARFRNLGAGKREAEAVVSAIHDTGPEVVIVSGTATLRRQ